MRRANIIVVMLILFSGAVMGQSSFGVKGGIALGPGAAESAANKRSVAVGFTAGGFYRLQVKRFLFMPEVNYTRKGAAITRDWMFTGPTGMPAGEGKLRVFDQLDYVEFPLLFGVQFNKWGFAAGPYYAYNIRAIMVSKLKGDTGNSLISIADRVEYDIFQNRHDVGAVASLFYRISVGKIALIPEIRYSVGFINYISDIYSVIDCNCPYPVGTGRNQSLQVNLALEFMPGKKNQE